MTRTRRRTTPESAALIGNDRSQCKTFARRSICPQSAGISKTSREALLPTTNSSPLPSRVGTRTMAPPATAGAGRPRPGDAAPASAIPSARRAAPPQQHHRPPPQAAPDARPPRPARPRWSPDRAPAPQRRTAPGHHLRPASIDADLPPHAQARRPRAPPRRGARSTPHVAARAIPLAREQKTPRRHHPWGAPRLCRRPLRRRRCGGRRERAFGPPAARGSPVSPQGGRRGGGWVQRVPPASSPAARGFSQLAISYRSTFSFPDVQLEEQGTKLKPPSSLPCQVSLNLSCNGLIFPQMAPFDPICDFLFVILQSMKFNN